MDPKERKIGSLALLLLAGICFVDAVTSHGIAVGGLYVGVVLLALSMRSRAAPLWAGFLSSLLLVLGFFLSSPEDTVGKEVTNRLIAGMAVWTVALLAYRRGIVERAFREKEALWRSILTHSPQIIATIDRAGRIGYINRTVPGLTREMVIGTSILQWIPPSEREKAAQRLTAIFDRGEQGAIEIQGTGPHGTTAWYAVHYAPMGEGNPPDAAILLCSDITRSVEDREALRQSRHFIEKIANTSPLVLYVYDLAEQRYEFVNTQIHRILGYDAAAFMKMTRAQQHELVHPEDRPHFDGALLRLTESRNDEIVEMNFRMRHADGSWRRLQCRSVVFSRDEGGRVTQILGSVHDVTARHEAEVALRASEARLRLFSEKARDILFILEPGGTLQFINPAVEQITGFSPEELYRDPARIMRQLSREDRNRFQELVEAAKARRLPEEIPPFRFRRKDGQNVWLECSLHCRYDEGGTLCLVEGIARNVTLKMQTLLELQMTRMAVEVAPDPISITDEAGDFLYLNPAFTTVTGYTLAELRKKNLRTLQVAKSPHDADAMWHTIRTGKTWKGSVVHRRKDGTHYPTHLTISPVIDPNGRVRNFVVVEKDLTTERSLRLQVMNLHRMSALNTLGTAVAHELNQPLTGIRVYAQALVDRAQECRACEPLSSCVQELGDKIEAQVIRVTQIIEHMREFSRGGTRMTIVEVPLAHVIDRVLELVGTQLRNHGIDIDVQIPEPLTIRTDVLKLEQVFINLLTNAREALLKKTHVRPKIEVTGFVREGIVHCRVADNGPGVPEDLRERIFDPFVTEKSNDGITGLGLGLAICHEIMKSLKGQILLERTDAMGTAFLLV
ncbi:MAG: PAS domain S-box protein, partial [Deltaproteobacteria bacterium]